MATKEQMFNTLNQAIDITKEYGKGGVSVKPAIILESAYQKIIEIIDRIEKEEVTVT